MINALTRHLTMIRQTTISLRITPGPHPVMLPVLKFNQGVYFTMDQKTREQLQMSIENAVDTVLGPLTFTKEDIDKAARGLAYLVSEGIDDPWELEPGPWSEDETVLENECDTDQIGLFLDIGETRYTLGKQGLIMVDRDTYVVVPKEHLMCLQDLLHHGETLGIL